MAANPLCRGNYKKKKKEKKENENDKDTGICVQCNLLCCVPNSRYARFVQVREAGMEFRSKTIGILNLQNEIPV